MHLLYSKFLMVYAIHISLSGQMSFWANVFLGKCLLGKCLWANVSGLMLYGQMSYHRWKWRGQKGSFSIAE
jgi:hypothetical protein